MRVIESSGGAAQELATTAPGPGNHGSKANSVSTAQDVCQ